jgi:hypothetical protein
LTVAAPAPLPVDRFFTARPALKARAVQHVRKLRLSARMNEAGTLTARGSVRVGARTFWFKRVSAQARPGLPVKLELRLPARALKVVRRALREDRKLEARLIVTARDAAGNLRVARRTIRLRP